MSGLFAKKTIATVLAGMLLGGTAFAQPGGTVPPPAGGGSGAPAPTPVPNEKGGTPGGMPNGMDLKISLQG